MADTMNFWDSVDNNGNRVQGYGMGAVQTGANLFGAWNSYQAMLQARKNNRFNRRLSSANYTNQAKASNQQLDAYTRYRQMMQGKTSADTARYMASTAYQDRRFKETL